MKLSINGIKNTTDWEKAGIKLPSYDVEKVAEDTKKSPVWDTENFLFYKY